LEKAKEKVARSMIQKLQELKLQVMSQNPQLLGVAMPQAPGNELGSQAGGPVPNDMSGQQPPPDQPPTGGEMDAGGDQQPGAEAQDTYGQPEKPEVVELPDPTDDELKMYDLEIYDLSQGIDDEEIDASEVEGE
jgi:hypothetical protein